MIKLGIFGSSGHARDIASIFNSNNADGLVSFINQEDESKIVKDLSKNGYVFIIGVGDNRTRKRIALKYSNLRWQSVICNTAHVSFDARIGIGTFIGHGAYVSSNSQILDHAIIHCSTVVGHDALVESFAQAAPGCCIGGNGVILREGAFLGANTTIINKSIEVGAWSMVSLGSVICENIPSEVLYQTIQKKVTLKIQTD